MLCLWRRRHGQSVLQPLPGSGLWTRTVAITVAATALAVAPIARARAATAAGIAAVAHPIAAVAANVALAAAALALATVGVPDATAAVGVAGEAAAAITAAPARCPFPLAVRRASESRVARSFLTPFVSRLRSSSAAFSAGTFIPLTSSAVSDAILVRRSRGAGGSQ